MLCRVVMFLLLVSLIAGYSEGGPRARAVDPDPCPQYECRTVHAYWSGLTDQFVTAYFQDAVNADQGFESMFTTNSVEKKPLQQPQPGSNVDTWLYPACTPFCGKDANGKWQALQEVLKSGTGEQNLTFARRPCTANGGNEGPKINPPVNANTDGYAIPGSK